MVKGVDAEHLRGSDTVYKSRRGPSIDDIETEGKEYTYDNKTSPKRHRALRSMGKHL